MSMDSDEHCVECGSDDVENSCGPERVYGSGDYSRYDGMTLVWLLPPDRIPPEGSLCDDCVDRHYEAGDLEVIHSGFDSSYPMGRPSEPVYAMMFREGAAEARQSFVHATRDRPAPQWPADDDAEARILRLRGSIGLHVPRRLHEENEREAYLDLARRTGQAHAIAACALGHADADPGFEAAAKAWAAERVAQDAEDALRRAEGEALWDELIAEMGGQAAVDEALAEQDRARQETNTPS